LTDGRRWSGSTSRAVSTAYAALLAAASFAKVFFDSDRQEVLSAAAAKVKNWREDYLYDRDRHRFTKAVNSDGSMDHSVDSSLASIFLFGAFDPRDEVVE
jgi:GH15 family glucan-1,4-alpha-glucosidase